MVCKLRFATILRELQNSTSDRTFQTIEKMTPSHSLGKRTRKEKVVMNYEIALYCRVSREKKGTTLHAFHSSVLVALLQN